MAVKSKYEYHKAKMAQGLCPCGKPMAPHSKRFCEDCLRYRREYAKKRYQESKQTGKCPVCDKKKPKGTKTVLCPDCAERQRENNKERYHQMKKKGDTKIQNKSKKQKGKIKKKLTVKSKPKIAAKKTRKLKFKK